MDNILDFIISNNGPINSVNISYPIFYGYTIHSDSITLIYKVILTIDKRLSYTFFDFQNINLKTREITKFSSPYLNEAIKVVNDKVYYKVKKLVDFLNIVVNNEKAFDSTIASIITALTTF